MALRPRPDKSEIDPKAKRQAASDEVLLREVDDAVRQDRYTDFGRRYGVWILGAIIGGLLIFGGYLWWSHRNEAALEADSEALVTALDAVQANNLESAEATLAPLADSDRDGIRAVALMLQGALAAEQGDDARAADLFDRIATDDDVPTELRDMATIRSVAARYDTMAPAQVVSRLQAIAKPGNAYFGSAGELVAMAYLDQGKTQEAGDLFGAIAKDESSPETLRSRARQMAGMLGVDTIDDVDAVIGGAAGAR